MLRYNKSYQALADEFAKSRDNGWTGAKYLGHYRENWCDAIGPSWLTFELAEEHGDDLIDGLFHYIFINEEEMVLCSFLRELPRKNFSFGAAVNSESRKIVVPKPVPRHKQYVVALTTEIE